MDSKRVLVRGEVFADWAGTLESFCAFADIQLQDVAFHPDDLKQEVYEARRSAYTKEADPLRLSAQYDALIAGTEPDYSEWVAAVKSIKERIPMPEQL